MHRDRDGTPNPDASFSENQTPGHRDRGGTHNPDASFSENQTPGHRDRRKLSIPMPFPQKTGRLCIGIGENLQSRCLFCRKPVIYASGSGHKLKFRCTQRHMHSLTVRPIPGSGRWNPIHCLLHGMFFPKEYRFHNRNCNLHHTNCK